MQTPWPGGDGSTRAAVAVCRACEQLLGGVEEDWPGGDADGALARLRARIDAIRPGAPEPAAGSCADTPRLEVRCLGPTRLTVGDAVIDPPRRSRLVLQYLLAHRPRAVPRDVLLDVFWPGSSPAAARNSLNVAITLLRRAFRPTHGDCPIVVYRDEAYRLDPSLEIWVNREEMERLAAEGAVAAAHGEHARRGGLLPRRPRAVRRPAVRGRALRGLDRRPAPVGGGDPPRRARGPGLLPGRRWATTRAARTPTARSSPWSRTGRTCTRS